MFLQKKYVFLLCLFLFSACDTTIPITDELEGQNLFVLESDVIKQLQNKDIILFKGYYFVKASTAISMKIPLSEGQKRAEDICKKKVAETESMRVTATKTLTETTKEKSGERDTQLKKHITAVSTTKLSDFRVMKTIREEIKGGLRITVYAIMKKGGKI